jgi:hypothetical protein
MTHDVKVLIRDCEDDPIKIWDVLKASFIQQRTAPRFNAYHTLLSIQKDDSEPLDSLINKVDEHIRVIKSLSPSSFTLDDLYDELAVMALPRHPPFLPNPPLLKTHRIGPPLAPNVTSALALAILRPNASSRRS